jgi:hypothetical protein
VVAALVGGFAGPLVGRGVGVAPGFRVGGVVGGGVGLRVGVGAGVGLGVGGGGVGELNVGLMSSVPLIVQLQEGLPRPVPKHDWPQPAKTELPVGVSVRVTVVPWAKSTVHVDGQLIPCGELFTVPAPVPWMWIVIFSGCWSVNEKSVSLIVGVAIDSGNDRDSLTAAPHDPPW